ncbi:hypothetical protein DL93DRAFT_2084137 [Clavulina sp. PMI_390]|nr:hypothetical protein DL93DRAFT_2084137 [Clavulina sp. PMI_390]
MTLAIAVELYPNSSSSHPTQILAGGYIKPGTRDNQFSFPLKLLGSPSLSSPNFTISCSARITSGSVSSARNQSGGAEYTTQTQLIYLPPNPWGGSTTKLDSRTGATLVKSLGRDGGSYEPIMPFGFYDSTGFVLNETAVLDMKAKGYNVAHPIPPFSSDADRIQAFGYLEAAGIYLIYDMRHDYLNLTSVEEQVSTFRSQSNLLMWYTADEPDGTQDALNGTTLASELIRDLDPYHPVSLVLNCFDYYWKEYSSGGDIVLQDVYPVGANLTWSFRGTECTTTYGDCGCDDCTDQDGLGDIGTRIDTFKERARWEGRERTMSFWSVPQAFGPQLYWPRWPTGIEFVAMSATGIIHGSTGVTAWSLPNDDDIYDVGGQFASKLTPLATSMFSPTTNFTFFNNAAGHIEAGVWAAGSSGLTDVLITVNLHNDTATLVIHPSSGNSVAKWQQVFESGSGATFDAGNNGDVTIGLEAFGTVLYTRS